MQSAKKASGRAYRICNNVQRLCGAGPVLFFYCRFNWVQVILVTIRSSPVLGYLKLW